MTVWIATYGEPNEGALEISVCGSLEIAEKELSRMKEEYGCVDYYLYEIEEKELIVK